MSLGVRKHSYRPLNNDKIPGCTKESKKKNSLLSNGSAVCPLHELLKVVCKIPLQIDSCKPTLEGLRH